MIQASHIPWLYARLGDVTLTFLEGFEIQYKYRDC
jgi:hypothetical protein